MPDTAQPQPDAENTTTPTATNSVSNPLPPLNQMSQNQPGQTVTPPASPPAASSSAPPPPAIPPTGKSRWPFILGIIVGLIMLIFGGWLYLFNTFDEKLTQVESTTPTLDRIKSQGKLIIGTDATFAPMEFADDSGQLVGYDIDLATRITEKLKVTPEFKQILFDDFIKILNNKEVDVVISSVTITDERKQLVDFSDQYLSAGQVIITRGDETSIKTTADLSGRKIAVQKGTTNEQQAFEFTKDELVLSFDDYIGATTALLNGEADAIFSDLTGAKGIIDQNPTLKIASEPFTNEQYGIVFRKGEEDLVAEVNSILNSLRQQGILVFLKQKWLE